MPNRVIREGFLDSEKINSLPENEQNFFVRLMLITDDYGRFEVRPMLIKSKCYPVTDISPSMVSNMLTGIRTAGLIKMYLVKGKEYLEINQYNQRLRQKKEKFPSPEQADDSKGQTDDGHTSPESNPIEKKPNEVNLKEGNSEEGKKIAKKLAKKFKH